MRTKLSEFLNSQEGALAIAIGRMENECKDVLPNASEIESVRAHSKYLGARAAYDFLYTLTQPLPVKPEIPESTYAKEEPTE